MSARLSRTARCRSIGQMTTRKPPPPAPVTLTPGSSGVQRPADRQVDLVVRDPGRQLPLGLPALAHRRADRVHVPLPQPFGGEAREVAQEVKLGTGGFDVRVLLGQDRVRAPGDARIEEHDLLLESPAVSGGQTDFLGDHLIAGPEADVPDPAERGNVLILLADGLPAALDLDRAGPLGKFLGRDLPSLVGEQGVQQAHGHGGR